MKGRSSWPINVSLRLESKLHVIDGTTQFEFYESAARFSFVDAMVTSEFPVVSYLGPACLPNIYGWKCVKSRLSLDASKRTQIKILREST
jgi:hypothetical protein